MACTRDVHTPRAHAEGASGSKSKSAEAEAAASGTSNTSMGINGGLEVAAEKVYEPEDGAIDIIQDNP